MPAEQAATLPLRFQIGARTLARIDRRLWLVPLSLADALEARLPALPPLGRTNDGYLVTSLPVERAAALAWTAGGLIAFERQRYTRHWIDLTIGADAYLARLSGNTRSAIKRKTRKLAEASGGTLEIARFRTPDELAAFHPLARAVSATTYQERLMDAGLPDTAAFRTRAALQAAAGEVRAWLLSIAGTPVAYLFCPVEKGTVLYQYLGHDPAFNDLSPGAVLQMAATRDLLEEGGLQRFDFTEGEGQHKRQFATDGVPCVDLLLLRGTLANRAALASLRVFDGGAAAAKRAVQRLGLEEWARKVRR
ncbi:GNAT family N-acetyltransferase [Sphingomonas aracearum]|uniref:GNAT family N-acetyltransferase n=1 Tax=Sphingomonas aracearum TaxID=2283317 RepID=A0A369VUX2_9SPHN|nr:GNAT family N-acetyltransferase [Sphingomonas aracearum]